MLPAFAIFNHALGKFVSGLFVLGIWYSNTWNTGYLPILSQQVYDHHAQPYDISRAVDDRGMYDHDGYMGYSAVYIGAAATVNYAIYNGGYGAVAVQVFLFHRREMVTGFKDLWRSLSRGLPWRRKREGEGEGEGEGGEGGRGEEYRDVHRRLMAVYPEG